MLPSRDGREVLCEDIACLPFRVRVMDVEDVLPEQVMQPGNADTVQSLNMA